MWWPRSPAQTDRSGISSRNTLFGDALTAQRHDLVSAHFAAGSLPSQSYQRIERWDLSGVVGSFVSGEYVRGGTSGAIGIIEDVVSPVRIRVLSGALIAGETITGIGTIATASGATATIAVGSHGRSAVADAVLSVGSGTAADTSCALESATLAAYHPGHEIGAWFTASFQSGSAGVEQWIGLMNRGGANGYAIGRRGDTFGFLWRRAGVDTFTPASSWAYIKDAPAELTADPAKIRIFGLFIGYLGVDGCILAAKDTLHRWHPLHSHTLAGAGTEMIFTDPHLVLRAETSRTSALGAAAAIHTGSWNVYTAGPAHAESVSGRTHGYEYTRAITATESAVFSLRNDQAPAMGGTNRAPLRLLGMSAFGDGNSGIVKVRIRKFAQLVTPSWAAYDSVDSIASIDITGTLGTATGKIVWNVSAVNRDGPYTPFEIHDLIVVDPGETITITATATQNQNVTVFVRWEESI